jgi:hypothetical protein
MASKGTTSSSWLLPRYEISTNVRGKTSLSLVQKSQDVITEWTESYIFSFHVSLCSLSFSFLQVRVTVQNALLRHQRKHVSPAECYSCAVTQRYDNNATVWPTSRKCSHIRVAWLFYWHDLSQFFTATEGDVLIKNVSRFIKVNPITNSFCRRLMCCTESYFTPVNTRNHKWLFGNVNKRVPGNASLLYSTDRSLHRQHHIFNKPERFM